MKQKRSLPVKVLREFFAYNRRTGELRYRENRARKWFKSDRLWKSWNAQFGGKIATRANGPSGYCSVSVNQRCYLAHRVIWAMMTGKWPKHEIDHINHDRPNNRWCNLREANRGQNARNISRPKNNKSGVMGVHWWKTGRLWQVYARRDGHRVVKYAKTFKNAVVLRDCLYRQMQMAENHGIGR
jgi:hypothetical protein